MATVYACLRDTLDTTPLPENGIWISARFLETITSRELDFMAANKSALPLSAIRRLWRILKRHEPLPETVVIVVSPATQARIMADKKHGTIRLKHLI